MDSPSKHCIAVFGPTCAGKTKLGVAIAKSVNGEVVSVDSMQCYNAGNIITATPRDDEMGGVPHHMINYLEPYEEPDDFVVHALEAVDAISRRRKTPILVGGSTSLTKPLLAEIHRRSYKVFALMLVPPHMDTYRDRINARADEMVDNGLLAEVAELLRLDELYRKASFTSNTGIWKVTGYDELRGYAAASGNENHENAMLEAGIANFKENTFKYAMDQISWMQADLVPTLYGYGTSIISLPVLSDETFDRDVEIPGVRMATEFCVDHMASSIRLNTEKDRPTICVFGGSSPGAHPAHMAAAVSLAVLFHRHNVKLVYGGATTGIMGAVASTLVALSGPDAVHGVIPAALTQYEAQNTCGAADHHVVPYFGHRTIVRDLHTRRRLMIRSVTAGGPGSGFVALSGGYETMEELLEVTTWHQIGIHRMPVCVLNVKGFYSDFLAWMRALSDRGFINKDDAGIVKEARTAKEVMDFLNKHQDSPQAQKLE